MDNCPDCGKLIDQ